MSALSLKCGTCGVQLKSVAECQAHGEATGHANFEESTEAVLNLQCTECGKPCRSDTERDLHTRRTGHAAFVDATAACATAIDSEAQMKEASAAAKAEAREAAGLPPAKEKPAVDEGPPVPAEVEAAALDTLVGMGFPPARATRALYFAGGGGRSDVGAAAAWLADHAGDGDVDDPLLVPPSRAKPKKALTKEEAAAAAAELLAKAKAKRAAEAAADEREREAARVWAGKELAAAARAEEAARLARSAAARAAEKAEAAAARAAALAALERDRAERGLAPADGAAARAAAAAAAADAARLARQAKPVSALADLRAHLVGMKRAAEAEGGPSVGAARECWALCLKYTQNAGLNPGEPKFRRIRCANAAFDARVARVPGGLACLEKAGWARTEEAGEAWLVLPPDGPFGSAAALLDAAGHFDSALNNPMFGAL